MTKTQIVNMMFPRILFFSICLQVAFSITVTAQSKPFSISGTITGKTNSYIYLRYENGDEMKIDSAMITNGKFSFKGQLDGAAQAYLMADRSPVSMDKYGELYLVPGSMQLSIDYNNFRESMVLKGSSVQDEADVLKKWRDPIMVKLKPYSEAYNKANMAYINARREKKEGVNLDSLKELATKAKDLTEPFYEELKNADVAFMDKYPASFVTASIMRYRISDMKLAEAEERYSKIPGAIKKTSLGKAIQKELEGLKLGSPGSKAYVFGSKELRGNWLSLADYKGKYVLVDFWASWCVPCRAGNPHLLALYKKYKAKGFEIIGISDDDSNPDAWKKAVEKDGIGVWKHVLRGLKYDGKDFDRTNDISEHFGIHTLPTKILIDPNGVIIGRYGGGGDNDEAMDKKLSEIFGE